MIKTSTPMNIVLSHDCITAIILITLIIVIAFLIMLISYLRRIEKLKKEHIEILRNMQNK